MAFYVYSCVVKRRIFPELLHYAEDVAVIQNIVGHDSGHVCIYDGQQWISDFVQRTLYPGQAYRNIQPHYELFRHD